VTEAATSPPDALEGTSAGTSLRAEIVLSVDGGRVLLDGSASRPAAGGPAIASWSWTARAGAPEPLPLPADGPRVAFPAPAADGEYYVTLAVADDGGGRDSAASWFAVRDGVARVPDHDREGPAWIDRAVGYGIVPFLFGEPPLQAAAARLDDLHELGVDLLWLSPTCATPPGDFGYAVTDYFAVRDDYGTLEDVRALVDGAHERGMRVIMDFVPNHTSSRHPWYVDGQERGEDSPLWGRYDRDKSGAATFYFEWEHLPNLNYEDPAVREHVTEAFRYWVRDVGVDGFRVDVAWGVKKRAPWYWPLWRRELKRIKPDLLLLAEAGARDPYYVENGYDVAYDWTESLGVWAWEDVWADEPTRASRLHAAITAAAADPARPAGPTMRFLNNNDTGERFVTRHGPELTRVATAALLTVPGIPMLFTGDEVGAEYTPYGGRDPISWDDRHGLRPLHRRLIAIRRGERALASRLWHVLDDGAHSGLLAYVRHGVDGERPVLVALNPTGAARTLRARIPARFAELARGQELHELIGGTPIAVGASGGVTVDLDAFDYKILVGI
jgi:glycosidase